METRKRKKARRLVLFCAYGALAGLLVYGVVARAAKTPLALGTSAPWIEQGRVKVRGQLSQAKIVQGTDGLVYFQIDLEAPEDAVLKHRAPTDFVVVLDRSGSMSGERKIDYAQKAVISLVEQMRPSDRFALVTFDSIIETPVSLVQVTSDNKTEILRQLRAVSPRGGTNLGGGLEQGIRIIQASAGRSQRAQRLIMLSDGMANEGITDLQALNRMAHQAVPGEFVISTIGVGLDFNETLLASLADHGTGHYHFLEDLAILDKVLAQEFYGASHVYAKQLNLDIDLAPGFELVEASGYPMVRQKGTIRVHPGHLYSSQKKTLFLTLRAPTDRTYDDKSVGRIAISYRVKDKPYQVILLDRHQKIACLPPEKKEEAHASIQPKVFKEAWTQNNYGRVLKESAEQVRKGDRAGALSRLKSYKVALGSAYAAMPAPELKQQMKDVEALEAEVDDSFSGPDATTKQKRFSKQKQAAGIKSQRSSAK